MAATQNRDMGSGSIPKLLAQLALPAVVAQVVNLLYNIVDASISAICRRSAHPR